MLWREYLHHATAQTGAEPILQPGQVRGGLVGGNHNLAPGIHQSVKRMEEFFLSIVLTDQELKIVDHQDIHGAKLLLELDRGLGANGRNKAVHELFGGHIGHRDIAAFNQFRTNGVHEVRFTQADATVQEERIKADAGGFFSHPARAGIGKFVGFADNERVKRKSAVQRGYEVAAHFGNRAACRAVIFRGEGGGTCWCSGNFSDG